MADNTETKTDEPEKTPEELRAKVESAPMPLEGDRIWDRAKGEEAYSLTADCLARALLIVADKDPSLLKVDAKDAWEAASNQNLWRAAKEEFPGLSDWLGGPTGFQFGWAHNLVRFIHGVDQVGNPAVVTVKDDGSQDS